MAAPANVVLPLLLLCACMAAATPATNTSGVDSTVSSRYKRLLHHARQAPATQVVVTMRRAVDVASVRQLLLPPTGQRASHNGRIIQEYSGNSALLCDVSPAVALEVRDFCIYLFVWMLPYLPLARLPPPPLITACNEHNWNS